MTRTLFYLPVITPWWFDNIVAPLIRTLHGETDIHILAPKPWRNTGIGADQLERCSDLDGLHWHIVDDESHFSLRSKPEDPVGLVAFVRSLAPDYVFCRSTDIATPADFPGKVVHLMEGGAPPFATDPTWIMLQRDYLHHGALPQMDEADRTAVEAAFAGPWSRLRERLGDPDPARADALETLGLAADRKVIALPLEYEHEEAFAAFHNRFERNIDLIRFVADRLDDRFLLAITDHPLNWRHVDNRAVHAAIEAMGSRARLLPNPDADASPTDLLMRHCDGAIVQNTKSIFCAASFAKPVLRLSHRPTADWIRADGEIEAFLAAVEAGSGGANPDQARLWFGCHLLHDVIEPRLIAGAELLDRVDRPFARERLAGGLDRFQAHERSLEVSA